MYLRRKSICFAAALAAAVLLPFTSYADPVESGQAVEETLPAETDAEETLMEETGSAAEETLPAETEASEPDGSRPADQDTGSGSRDFDEAVATYQETLVSLENESASLTPAEEAEGYRVINGIKYSPGELEGDDPDDVIYGSVPPGPRTGYLTVRGILPDYIHEPAYVRLFNLNNYKVYGLNLYETNGFVGDICLPSGTYLINEAGLLQDAWGRFYARQTQVNVRSGSVQSVVIEIIDSQPEEKEMAYRTTAAVEETEAESTEQTAVQESTAAAVSGDGVILSETTQSTGQETEIETKKKKPVWKLILSILFTVLPIGVLIYLYFRFGEKKSGFYD